MKRKTLRIKVTNFFILLCSKKIKSPIVVISNQWKLEAPYPVQFSGFDELQQELLAMVDELFLVDSQEQDEFVDLAYPFLIVLGSIKEPAEVDINKKGAPTTKSKEAKNKELLPKEAPTKKAATKKPDNKKDTVKKYKAKATNGTKTTKTSKKVEAPKDNLILLEE